MSEVILISNARLSFPHITEPQTQVNQQTGATKISYNIEIILGPHHPGLAQFMQRYYELAQAEWKENVNAVMQMIEQDRKSRCYGRGEEKINKKTFQPYDGYPGNLYITAGRDTPPQVIQDNGTAIDPTNTMAYQQLTRKMYGGCRVNVAIKPWLQKPNREKQYGPGIRCDLVAIQFASDDVAFGEGGNVDASGMFGAVVSAPSPTPVIPGMGMPALPFGGVTNGTGFPPVSAPHSQPVAGIAGLPPFLMGQ